MKIWNVALATLVWVPGGFGQASVEKEAALGKHLADEVEARSRIVKDPAVAKYIERLAENLAGQSGMQFRATVKVIEGEEPSASSLPGGYFFVSSGLILRTGNEAELAGILAHEIAHVAARHGVRRAAPGSSPEAAAVPLVLLGGEGGICTRLAREAVVPIAFQSMAQRFEEEADLLGVEYLDKAGYDPHGLTDGFQRLQAPASGRAAEVLGEKPAYIVTTSEFNEVKKRLREAAH